MECPHLNSNVSFGLDSSRFPNGTPSSWCCNVCRSNKSPWICLTCLMVHCGRYVNGHAKKHFEDSQVLGVNLKKGEKPEKEKSHHSVCMDCSNYSIFCYRCDDFIVNDTKLGQVQKVREHLQSLENSALISDRQRKRKLQESLVPDSKMLKDSNGAALGATGLRNLGNTCFMNAILQSLRSLVEEFRKTLCSLWQGNQTAFSPDSLFYAIWKIMPSFRGYQQQDAHEFMRYLLDHLHRELQCCKNGAAHPVSPQDGIKLSTSDKSCLNGTASVVTSIFGGILQNEVNCLICGTESRKFDPFLDLSLDIPSQFRQKRSKDQEPGPTCTLPDCLRSFTDLEELDETELYYCHKCKKRQKSTKKFWIQKLPRVLCLHLKRFHWTAFLRNKVDTYVEFPLRGLDMRGFLLEVSGKYYCGKDGAFNLKVSLVGSGHYTAYGSHEGHWYHFNDSTVTLTTEDTVRKAKAYILFYVERTGQMDSDETATKNTATDKPGVEATAVNSVSSNVVQDQVAPNTKEAHGLFKDVAALHVVKLDPAAPLNVADDVAEMATAVTDRDTSDMTPAEDATQTIHTVAQ
uniref:ubiquitinyl hydrolase 1 n=1 Tax=Sphaeramia orbicularis TaxID=375764 RepID=A0A673CXF9_9TELE